MCRLATAGQHAQPGFKEDFAQTLEALLQRGKKVVVLGMVPQAPEFDLKCHQKALKPLMPDCRNRPQQATYPAFNARLQQWVARHEGIEYLDMTAQTTNSCSGAR